MSLLEIQADLPGRSRNDFAGTSRLSDGVIVATNNGVQNVAVLPGQAVVQRFPAQSIDAQYEKEYTAAVTVQKGGTGIKADTTKKVGFLYMKNTTDTEYGAAVSTGIYTGGGGSLNPQPNSILACTGTVNATSLTWLRDLRFLGIFPLGEWTILGTTAVAWTGKFNPASAKHCMCIPVTGPTVTGATGTGTLPVFVVGGGVGPTTGGYAYVVLPAPTTSGGTVTPSGGTVAVWLY